MEGTWWQRLPLSRLCCRGCRLGNSNGKAFRSGANLEEITKAVVNSLSLREPASASGRRCKISAFIQPQALGARPESLGETLLASGALEASDWLIAGNSSKLNLSHTSHPRALPQAEPSPLPTARSARFNHPG